MCYVQGGWVMCCKVCYVQGGWIMCCKVCFKTKDVKVFTKSFAHHLLRASSSEFAWAVSLHRPGFLYLLMLQPLPCKVDVLRARWMGVMCCKVCFKTKDGKVFTKSFASTHHLLRASSSEGAWAVSLHRPGFLYLLMLHPLLMLRARWMCYVQGGCVACKVDGCHVLQGVFQNKRWKSFYEKFRFNTPPPSRELE